MQLVGVTPTYYLYKDRLLFVFRPAYAKTKIKSAYYRLIKATDRNLRLYSATEGEGIYIERSKVRFIMDTVWDVGEMPTMKKLFFYRFKKFYTVI